MRRLLLIPLAAAVSAVLAAPAGVALANRYDADADCDGFEFSMPATEDGTTVTLYRNGVTVREVRNEIFGRPVVFTVSSPDPSVSQTWRVTVVGHNGASEYTETVAACLSPSTTVPAATTTVPPVTGSTVVTTTTTPATVITTPRTPGSTIPPASTVPLLPATGSPSTVPLSLIAAAVFCAGLLALLVSATRRRPKGDAS